MLDRLLGRERSPSVAFGSVNDQITAVRRQLEKREGWGSQGYYEKLESYLEFARECGLDGNIIVHSCFDLAATLSPDFCRQAENNKKIENWKKLRSESLKVGRGARKISMNLDPAYFQAILVRDKSFEGRAFDPDSIKNYQDIRSGDVIEFTLRNRDSWQKDQCKQLGVKEGMAMEANVEDVLFSPLVHWMYQFNHCDGGDFQPRISGPSELICLQSAGVYYEFPDYPDRIGKYGFIGIEVNNPKLIS